MDPKNNPKQPNPADTTRPTKDAPDTQSADAENATNLPRPAAAPPAPEPEKPSSDTETATETPTDSTASTTSSDAGNDSDPGASNTSNDEPL